MPNFTARAPIVLSILFLFASLLSGCSHGTQVYPVEVKAPNAEVSERNNNLGYLCQTARLAGTDVFRYDCKVRKDVTISGGMIRYNYPNDADIQLLGVVPQFSAWQRMSPWIFGPIITLLVLYGFWIKIRDRHKRTSAAPPA